MTDADQRWLRASFALAERAKRRGDEPYGAVLVDAAGRLLLEAENTIVTGGDCTGHAEINLVRALSGRFDAATLAGATLYASTEPCAMCAGAIHWSGIGRVVYGLSNARLYDEVPAGESPALRLGCRAVFAAGERKVAVEGPWLEDEAAAVVRADAER
jgi:tRNA(Arg) A34 adenosine deaminase TadA